MNTGQAVQQSRDERRRRLAEVPERFRTEVERQVRMAWRAR